MPKKLLKMVFAAAFGIVAASARELKLQAVMVERGPTSVAGNDPWPGRHLLRVLVSNHKSGSTMMAQVAQRACGMAVDRLGPVITQVPAEAGPTRAKHVKKIAERSCYFYYSKTFEQEPCGARSMCEHGDLWSCCPSPRLPFEKYVGYKGIAVLRDPIHLMVSHYWYDFDGHEHGVKYDNVTEGLVYQMTKNYRYGGVSALAVTNQFVRRNSPQSMRIACLEVRFGITI